MNRRDGVVVGASASQSVDLGFIPLVESYRKTLKKGICNFPAWRSAFRGGCGEQAGKFACCVLGQGTKQDAPLLCRSQVAHKHRKRQLPSECGLLVQSIAIQFAFSRMEDKYGKQNKNKQKRNKIAQKSPKLATFLRVSSPLVINSDQRNGVPVYCVACNSMLVDC